MNISNTKPPVDNSPKPSSDKPKPNPCPCCECDDIKVYFESIETNGVVTGFYLSHPSYKDGTTETLDCEVAHLDFYEWYDTRQEAIDAWNSGEAIENARKGVENAPNPTF